MGPSARVLRSAIVSVMCLGALAGVRPAAAQQSESVLASLGYLPDPLARSPRLLAMGQLVLADDLHNRIGLWDFAGNPTGIAEAESVSTFEYRPVSRASSILNAVAGSGFAERQQLGARQMRHGIETWRRSPGAPAYGLIADMTTLQVDRTFSQAAGSRGRFKVPAIGGAVNTRVPWIRSDRFGYALRLQYGREIEDDGYFEFLRLPPQGEYLGKKTAIVPPPDLFTPNRVETSNLSGGMAISARVTPDIKAAIGYDRALSKVRGTLDGLRSTSKADEDRPYDLGQATVIGRLGRHLEWGADGRAWRSQSEQFFFWSISAGATQAPLSGSGKRLDRDVRGTSLRTRVRWTSGRLELGAGFGTGYRREIVHPWYPTVPGDPAGFNDFLGEVGSRAGADTLLLPQRVTFSQVEERSVDVVGGASWQLPGRRGMVGAEFERRRTKQAEPGIGRGPRPVRWDVRLGGEYRVSEAFLARAGWNYGIHDRDELRTDQAFRSAVATAGFGVHPPGVRWSIDLGYAYEWARPDFVDPARSREDNQHLALQMRWPF